MVHNRIFCRICLKHGKSNIRIGRTFSGMAEKIDAFMAGHAEYRDVYNSYPYAVQRWDMIRYLILYEYGGIYADLDYECIDAL